MYWEWTASGDVFYSAAGKNKEYKLQAVLFAIDDDKLAGTIWTSTNSPKWERATGLIYDNGHLYVPSIGGKGSGMCMLDAQTGKIVRKGGANNSNC